MQEAPRDTQSDCHPLRFATAFGRARTLMARQKLSRKPQTSNLPNRCQALASLPASPWLPSFHKSDRASAATAKGVLEDQGLALLSAQAPQHRPTNGHAPAETRSAG